MLTPEHLPSLTEEEIRPFFYIEHNKHWTGLYRQVNRVCRDMVAFRTALLTLVDESRPIEHRVDEAAEAIWGLGKGILTAFLVVAFPAKYGVLNNTSEAALVELDLTPAFERGMSLGARYVRMNEVFLRLAQELDVDLWTLDTLWWEIVAKEDSEPTRVDLPASAASSVQDNAAQFGLERHLHAFLFDNWASTSLGRDWAIFSRPGEPDAGYEFTSDVGRIDILAKHKTEQRWLVVELKRGQSTDAAVGQTLRYMGWVKGNLAELGEVVEGLIIAQSGDTALHYAVSAVPGLAFKEYRVEFQLVDAPPVVGREAP
jgi:hypothetical protein